MSVVSTMTGTGAIQIIPVWQLDKEVISDGVTYNANN